MEYSNSIQMGRIPLTQGEASLPDPASHKQQSLNYANSMRDAESDDIYLKMIPPWTYRELFIAGTASTSVTFATLSLIIAYINPVVLVTSVLGIIVPPYSALQEQKITDCKAMRQTNVVMEQELNNFQYNNDRLHEQNDELEATVDRLKDMKDAYKECQSMKVVSIESLEAQLKNSEAVLATMEGNRVEQSVQNIFDVMMAVDIDMDGKLSDSEIDDLTKKIEGIGNVEIADAAFKRKIVESGRSIDGVMNLLRGLLAETAEGEDNEDPTSTLHKSSNGERIFKFL